MKVTPVTSSQISHIGHDAENNKMVIVFARGGSPYMYDNVTAEKHATLIGDGTGIGSRFHQMFKKNAEEHPYSKYDGPVEMGEAS